MPVPPPSVPATGHGDATAQGGADNITNTANTTNATDDTHPGPVSSATSASASATASPSPGSPPRIVSDIQPAPAAPTPASTSVASPALSASPSVHSLGTRPGLTVKSRSNTPRHSPALPSPPVALRASPATNRPPQAANYPPPPPGTKASHYQNSPVWGAQTPQAHKTLPLPPAPAPASGSPAATPTHGFPSPGREHVHTDPKFLDDKTRITYGIQQAVPEAVRRSVRDNWEKCLLGSEFHQAFIVSQSPSLSSCHTLVSLFSLFSCSLALLSISAPHDTAPTSCPSTATCHSSHP